MNSSKAPVIDFRGLPLYRRIKFNRPLASYSRLRGIYGAVVRGRGFQVARLNGKAKFLNAGCGPNLKPGFVNLDYEWLPGIDLCWDLKKRLPFDDNSLMGIYSEHCLEHFEYDECKLILAEFKRILSKGGVLRIVVPDAELYLGLYAEVKAGGEVKFPYAPKPLPGNLTPLMAVNTIFFNHGHRYAYDEATMTLVLREIGFDDVRKESFNKGRNETLLIDSPERAVESLYVEACVQ